MTGNGLKIVVIGGGIGGLFAANALIARGFQVAVYEQAANLGFGGLPRHDDFKSLAGLIARPRRIGDELRDLRVAIQPPQRVQVVRYLSPQDQPRGLQDQMDRRIQSCIRARSSASGTVRGCVPSRISPIHMYQRGPTTNAPMPATMRIMPSALGTTADITAMK